MTQHEYDVFVGELFKKYPELREATRDPRSRGETKPWYNQTDEYGRYEVSLKFWVSGLKYVSRSNEQNSTIETVYGIRT